MNEQTGSTQPPNVLRDFYQQGLAEIRAQFEKNESTRAAGPTAVKQRAQLADELVQRLWSQFAEHPKLKSGVAIVAIGGYGRRQLFPHSDLDVLFLLDNSLKELEMKDPIRRINQEIWDCGIRASPQTRLLSECDGLIIGNPEFTLSLMDHRFLCGDRKLYDKLANDALPKLLQRDHRTLINRLVEITLDRHGKYANTLFHLEPNIKDCPGGLRDMHVCGWLTTLYAIAAQAQKQARPEHGNIAEFNQATDFLATVRCFLHYAHERDDNTLYWQSQDAAAKAALALGNIGNRRVDASVWMRSFFRNARTIHRRTMQLLEEAPRVRGSSFYDQLRRRHKRAQFDGFHIQHGRIVFDPPASPRAPDPANDPDTVLNLFEAIATHGCKLSSEAEESLEPALPVLASNLEEGPALWSHFRNILNGPYAGEALRAMHALGILELIVPEFLGIDALVIRDAYHRYTVDEHTFVLIDVLHNLQHPPEKMMANNRPNTLAEWQRRFGGLLADLPHPELLYLAALMHDTGKGRETPDHSKESARMAKNLFARMELDPYEAGIVRHLIVSHLVMSATLRRDIFDLETLRVFVEQVESPEQLRMLALLTYADISAVHPDALTPWKAENLWNLYIGASNYLDRTVDDDRVRSRARSELIQRVTTLAPAQSKEIRAYLQGFPQRYLRTRTPEQVHSHFIIASTLVSANPAAKDTEAGIAAAVDLILSQALPVSEITLVALDRPRLFATIAGALAAWGMDIVNADAFANGAGIVVDSFSFIDRFRTLELNPTEHKRFVKSLKDALTGATPVEKLLAARTRGGKRKPPKVNIETQINFDHDVSSHSTLLQVVAQDVPGLLRAISLTVADHECNIEVALIDTEGEMAIDVFYITRAGQKLDSARAGLLRDDLIVAIARNTK
jgi:[protein-PII] uridylyltransferase